MASKMTDKQRLFARCMASGTMSMSDAYREAYQTGNMLPATVRRESSRLMTNNNVTTMVKRLRDEYERNKQIKELSSHDLVIEKLKHFIENGENTDTVKLRAVEILARASGMFVDRVETKNVDRESGEIAAEIESKLAELLREPESDSAEAEDAGAALH